MFNPLVALFVVFAQTGAPAKVTLAEFNGLRFLEGSWKGSGYQPGPFYESYRFINDSTIEMAAWTDSTFKKKSDSTLYLFRNGEIRSRGGEAAVIRIDSFGYHFRRLTGQSSGWVFRRISQDRWTATLGGGRTVYTLDRVTRHAWTVDRGDDRVRRHRYTSDDGASVTTST